MNIAIGVIGVPWFGSHDFLNEYIVEHASKRIMEIGVYNGENAKNMVKAAVKKSPPETVEYYGFDFFSSYSEGRIGEKLEKIGCKYRLFKGNSLETVPEAAKSLPLMDVIFIDGGKSFNVALSDWEGSSLLMHEDTAVFVHNAGFSGVRRMVEAVPRDRYDVEVFSPMFEGRVALIKKKK